MPAKKWNPWPVAIITYFACFITATVCFVIFTLSHNMDLVAKDYYAQEIKHQQQMDRVKRTQNLPVQVNYDPQGAQITLTLPAEHATNALSGTVHLYRPSDAKLDRQLPLATDATGRQHISTHDLLPGLWKVRIAWAANEREYYHDQNLVVKPTITN